METERREALRVLIVDDSPEIRLMFELALSREAKCDLVGEAEDGEQALEKVELLRPDVVVMDLQMPVMDGIDATREIKSRWPRVEVVGFTSSGRRDVHDKMVEAGAADSFDKGQIKSVLEFIRVRAAARGRVTQPTAG
jgi:CheY-like chemotaxis protein